MPSEAVVHVVDDDMAVRQSLSFLLASDGWPVRLHESASAFLDGVKEAAAAASSPMSACRGSTASSSCAA